MKKRYGKLYLTVEFMDSEQLPQMLLDLQATPVHMDYKYCKNRFEMIVVSPLLLLLDEGQAIPLCVAGFDEKDQKYIIMEY